jgi:translation initiation factor 3 subunit I
VKTGKSIKYMRFVYKLKQVEFDYGSKRFLLLHDEYKPHTPSRMKVYDFKTLFNSEFKDDVERIPRETDFATLVPGDKQPNKTSTRALWYADNQSFFVATTDGCLIHYAMSGDIIGKGIIHDGVKINSIAFSKNFAVLATAADNGSKIVDPETFEVLRYFKQELPMNAVSISPLFSSESKPKFHSVMGGGVSAIMAAMTAGNAGFEAHVCNVLHGNEVGKISGHYGPINSIEFFRDGRGFVSGGEEGIIRVVRFAAEYFEENNPQFE